MGKSLEKYFLVIFVLLFESVLVSSVVINELVPNPSGDEGLNEWIELFNPSGTPVDLTGWTLEDDDSGIGQTNVALFGSIAGNGYRVFQGFGSTGRLANAGDVLFLKNGGAVIDTVIYGSIFNDGEDQDKSFGRVPNGDGSFRKLNINAVTKNSLNCPIRNVEQDKCYSLTSTRDAMEELGEGETLNLFGNPIDPNSLVGSILSDEGPSILSSTNSQIKIGADSTGQAFGILAEYSSNPGTANPMFFAGSSYFEVFLEVTNPIVYNATITFCGISGSVMMFFNKQTNLWVVASNQAPFSCEGGGLGIQVIIDDTTTPNLAQLSSDPPFGSGNPVGVPAVSGFGLIVLLLSLLGVGYFWK